MEKRSIPKISVLVITYNQQDVIGRALESILIQKEYVYEIIVSDDCSSDNNWEVIKSYSDKYPELITPIRHERNLGIFGNIESLYNKPKGDVIYWLAGDDCFCNGLFKNAIKLIESREIDFKNELFCIYCDHKIVYPNGASRIFSNHLIEKNCKATSLKLRQLLSNRAAGYSSRILKCYNSITKDIGIYTDALIDIQQQIYATNNYYFSFVGAIYYADIGISKRTLPVDLYKSKLLFHEELKSIVKISPADEYHLKFVEKRILLSISFSLISFFELLFFYIMRINFKLGFDGLQLSKIFFYIKRKL